MVTARRTSRREIDNKITQERPSAGFDIVFSQYERLYTRVRADSSEKVRLPFTLPFPS